MTSRQNLLSRAMTMRRAAAATIAAAAIGLSGCSLLPTDGPAADPAPAATSAAAAVGTQQALPESAQALPEPTQALTAAEALGKKLEESLGALAQTTKAPNRTQMLDAMLKAGAVKEGIEVSIDVTPTGLAVDAIEAATPVAAECVVGQVRDGAVAVTILPVLATGRCFVGEVNPLP